MCLSSFDCGELFVTVTNFIEITRERCRSLAAHIGFPEADDVRVVTAAHQLLTDEVVSQVTLFTDEAQATTIAAAAGIRLATVRDRLHFLPLADRLERLNQAAAMVKTKALDAVLAGNISTTADVIRAGLGQLGLAPGVKTVSGSFVMHKPHGPTYVFADCGVVIAPTVPQLVDIATESVRTWELLMPDTPAKVAFLSYSTKGSAKHETQARIAEAAALFKQRRPDVLSDGELQFDAAIDQEIAAKKAPGSSIGGEANCFIFPSLEAGNIACKITQRLGGFDAYGPILQGLAGAYSDLSRGSTVQDIVLSAYINILRSQAATI